MPIKFNIIYLANDFTLIMSYELTCKYLHSLSSHDRIYHAWRGIDRTAAAQQLRLASRTPAMH